ncbi:uncharacterized protein A4U43_C08F35650 [Asparagus officinalis]|nr:uncharacterized protein A4U43_C08F35650 [Asparagus officinalis]
MRRWPPEGVGGVGAGVEEDELGVAAIGPVLAEVEGGDGGEEEDGDSEDLRSFEQIVAVDDRLHDLISQVRDLAREEERERVCGSVKCLGLLRVVCWTFWVRKSKKEFVKLS